MKASSSEDPTKVLYRYFMKFYFKGTGLKSKSLQFQDLNFFSDEEINLFRATLRESIDQVSHLSKELFSISEFVKEHLISWDVSDSVFMTSLQKFLHLYETRASEGITSYYARF